MLSLLKKNSDKAKAAQAPAWHTNFRNFAVLPDTKLVRTSFFVNGLLIVLAVASLLAVAYQEYTLSILRGQNNDLQTQIDKNRAASSRAVALYKQFQAEEVKITELNGFVKGQKIVYSDLLIRLSQNKPAGIVFLTVEYKDTGAVIKGYAQGISEQATSAASAYERQLRDDPQLNTVFKSISLTNVSRDVQAGRLMFEIILSFNLPKAK
ncbi:MAG: hypothetical protein QM715_06825 [Nibricoccus sp.]